jgi:RHS repeat-associated protein
VSDGQTLTQRYYAWGGIRPGPNNALPTDYTFTGQKLDATGLMYYGARYYDAYLNRWIQPDTIVPQPGNPQDLNRYSYARNNPLKYVDPSGHFVIAPIIGLVLIGAGVFAAINEAHQISNYAQEHNMGFWEAAVAKDLTLDQGSMVDSAFKGGAVTLLVAEGGALAFGGLGLGVQQIGKTFNSPEWFGTGMQMTNASIYADGLLKGGLTNAQVRQWYNAEMQKIDTNGSLTEKFARQVYEQRNAIKVQARELMADKVSAAELDIVRPIEPFEYYVEKYSAQGYSGEELWARIIQGSVTPNADVNAKFGIK